MSFARAKPRRRHADAIQQLGSPVERAASRRDPTRSVDLRNRLRTRLRLSINDWRKLIYAAVVEDDVLGYSAGVVDLDDLQDLSDKLNELLTLQANSAFGTSYDNLDFVITEAYQRGIATAVHEMQTTIPFGMTADDVLRQSISDLDDVIDYGTGEIARRVKEAQAASVASRFNLYRKLLLPVLGVVALRLGTLANTNITRAYNGGKLDVFEIEGVDEVGIEAETLPEHEHSVEKRAAEAEEPVEEPDPEEPGEVASEAIGRPRSAARLTVRPPRLYAVQTVGDDKVCRICEELEANSPYSLDVARSLIPAHPNCRCAVVAAMGLEAA